MAPKLASLPPPRGAGAWLIFALALAAAVASAISCAEAPPAPLAPSCSPDLASLQRDVFSACLDCHGSTTAEPGGGLVLQGDDLAIRLLRAPSVGCPGEVLVAPGEPERSLLWNKVARKTACGDPMPPLVSLSDEHVACIGDWIRALAPCERCGGSACVDLLSDKSNCGACGAACGLGQACIAGACEANACGVLATCGGTCADLANDPKHCGACGNACGAAEVCAGGVCVCAPGMANCAGDCVDTTSDPAHCGACGVACPAGKVCLAGSCTTDCGALTQCGAACVDTSSNAKHCGACDKACPGDQTCTGGACKCPGSTALCNGVCVDTKTSSAHCGGCGKPCTGGQSCQDGTCACPTGQSFCSGTCINTATDVANCGACGKKCDVGLNCTGGACTCPTAPAVAYAAQVQSIWNSSCTSSSCHGGTGQAGLILTTNVSHPSLVNAPATQCNGSKFRVTPGAVSTSYLMDKLLGTNMCSGTKMPKSGTLTNAQIETVARWICQGAPNN